MPSKGDPHQSVAAMRHKEETSEMTACEKEKLQKLQTVIGDCAAQDICVAFSGGVDSALLLKLACDAAARTKKTVWAVTFDTVLHPAADMAVAKQVASEMGANHAVLFVDELSDPQMKFNPVNGAIFAKKVFLKDFWSLQRKRRRK